uniref:Homeobox domain-containing protein n=1 Tax=Caenorhabditis tropicalis TaxID=1561998 RepID=A0A1I7T097_9PELO
MEKNPESREASASEFTSRALEKTSFDVLGQNTDKEECNASVSQTQKLDLWRVIEDKSKVIETFYVGGNFYHDVYLQELAELAGTTHKNVRDTLSRLRKRDEKAGRYVPPPPRQQYEFTEEQRNILETAFKECRQLDSDGTKELTKITNLTPKQIGNWFCNQRRKADGRSAEKDRKRRQRLREEMIKSGRGRLSTFAPDVLELFELEYEKMKQLSELSGQTVKFPYGMLVEKTGMNRKKMNYSDARDVYNPSMYEERKFFGDVQESKDDLACFTETGTSSFTTNFTHRHENDYEALRMKYDDLLEANRVLMENNETLSNELEVWEATSESVGKNVRELMGNKELRGVNIKFLQQMEEWKTRCLAAEDKCVTLNCELDALKNDKSLLDTSSQSNSYKPRHDSQTMMYFEQMEQWHNKYKLVEKEKEALTARLQASQNQEKVLLDRLKNNGMGGPIQYSRNVESSKKSTIFLDNDVEVWKSYTYSLRRDLEREKIAHQKTKDELTQIRANANGYLEECAEAFQDNEVYEPATKIQKVEEPDDYTYSDPKFEEL